MTRRALFFGLLLGTIAVAGAGGCSRGEAARDGDTAVAKRGTLVVWVTARGKVTAESQAVVSPPRWWGMKVSRLVAKEGDRVEKGDVIMELQIENLDERIRDVTRDIRSSEGSLESTRANLRSESDRLRGDVQRATEDVAKAKQALDDLKALPLATDLRNAEIDRATTAKAAEQARVRWDTMKRLHASGGASLKQLEERELAFRAADAEARRADLKWQVMRAGPRKETLRDAEITLEQADLARLRAERTRDLTLLQIEESVRKSEAYLNMNRQTLIRIQRVQDGCTVRAPTAGMVYYGEIDSDEGQEKIREGMEVRPWNRLAELPDSTRMQISVEVEETDVGKVEVGQEARIMLDAYRDKRLAGKVAKIECTTHRKGGREIGRGNAVREDLGTKAVDVVVNFSEPDPLVRNGLNGRAEICTSARAEGILVPLKAVFAVGGRDVVHVVRDGQSVETPVVVGGRSDSEALILSGLGEGDRVSLAAPARSGGAAGGKK